MMGLAFIIFIWWHVKFVMDIYIFIEVIADL